MGIEKRVLSVRLDDETIDALKAIAKNENRTLSNLIETVLKQRISMNNGEQVLGEQKKR